MLEPERGGVAAGRIRSAGRLELLDRHRFASDAQNLPPAAAWRPKRPQLLSRDGLHAAFDREAQDVAIEAAEARQILRDEPEAPDFAQMPLCPLRQHGSQL